MFSAQAVGQGTGVPWPVDVGSGCCWPWGALSRGLCTLKWPPPPRHQPRSELVLLRQAIWAECHVLCAQKVASRELGDSAFRLPTSEGGRQSAMRRGAGGPQASLPRIAAGAPAPSGKARHAGHGRAEHTAAWSASARPGSAGGSAEGGERLFPGHRGRGVRDSRGSWRRLWASRRKDVFGGETG